VIRRAIIRLVPAGVKGFGRVGGSVSQRLNESNKKQQITAVFSPRVLKSAHFSLQNPGCARLASEWLEWFQQRPRYPLAINRIIK
jgi:hypothetical protein